MPKLRLIFLFVFLLPFDCSPVFAQTTTQTFVLGGPARAQGGGGPSVQIAPEQKMMFDAANLIVQRDFKGAESLYSQVIAMSRGNIEAYLQRGVVRREMGDEAGMMSDARNVVILANNALQQAPRDPTLYYRRGMGFRLLREFDQAKNDILTGMRIGGKTNWQNDLQAIDLERKVAK
jgi:hypothetical protein